MPLAPRAVLALVAIPMSLCTLAQTPQLEAARTEVFAAERAYALSMAQRDFAAFGRHVAQDTVFFGSHDVQSGKAAVLAKWQAFYEGPNAPFAWEPDQVEVLASGLLALSTGPVRNPKGEVIARFNSIWQRQSDGHWRVIFDKGSPPDPVGK